MLLSSCGTMSRGRLGCAGMAVMVVDSAGMGLTTGTQVMVARVVGARDAVGANGVAERPLPLQE